MSISPRCPRAAAMRSCTPCSVAASPGTAKPPVCSATAFAARASRSLITTRAPAAANLRASARPIPAPAPVTTTPDPAIPSATVTFLPPCLDSRRLSCPGGPPLADQHARDLKQPVGPDRLGQELVRSPLQRHHRDRQPGIHKPQRVNKLEPGHPRHVHVGHDQIPLFRRGHPQRGRGVGRMRDVEPPSLAKNMHRIQCRLGIVLDYEDPPRQFVITYIPHVPSLRLLPIYPGYQGGCTPVAAPARGTATPSGPRTGSRSRGPPRSRCPGRGLAKRSG